MFMRKHIKLIIACFFIIVVLSLTSCQECVHAHDVPYTYYTQHCLSYNSNGHCVVNVPLKHTGYESHCDEWKSS